jgi:RNA-dependent RNA polymerase
MNIFFKCCLQIRYKGAKGVLLLNEELKGKTIVLRKSMIKYECNEPAAKKYLDILSWDKYLSGYLNRQIIILLKSLNISD